jgi:hypothetical protein
MCVFLFIPGRAITTDTTATRYEKLKKFRRNGTTIYSCKDILIIVLLLALTANILTTLCMDLHPVFISMI